MRQIMALIVPALLMSCAMSEPARPKILVFFEHASTVLSPLAEHQVEGAAKVANESPSALVTVAGYAAAHGDLDVDAQIAAQRAQLVATALQQDGVAASRIQVIPRAPSNEDSAVGARRVEIIIGDAAAN